MSRTWLISSTEGFHLLPMRDAIPRLVPRHRRTRHIRPVTSPHPVLDSTSRPRRHRVRREFSLAPTYPVGRDAVSCHVEIPGRISIEAGDDRFLVPTRLSRLPELDPRIAVLAEHPFERDVTEHLVPTDRTPEELEHRRAIPLDRFETR